MALIHYLKTPLSWGDLPTEPCACGRRCTDADLLVSNYVCSECVNAMFETWDQPPTRTCNGESGTPGFAWASWDHESGRRVTVSFYPDGQIQGSGYGVGEFPTGVADIVIGGPRAGTMLDLNNQAARDSLWYWLVDGVSS